MRWKTADAEGTLECEVVVNCGGQWARELGRRSGVTVPLYPAEHFYLVTKPIAGVTPDLPVIRDPDGFLYYKEEVGGLVMPSRSARSRWPDRRPGFRTSESVSSARSSHMRPKN